MKIPVTYARIVTLEKSKHPSLVIMGNRDELENVHAEIETNYVESGECIKEISLL
jgi:hypothetical protein